MKLCPVCGGPVPLGGGKTVQNAHRILQAADSIEAEMREAAVRMPETEENARERNEEIEQVRAFVAGGRASAGVLHDYGHRRTNPPRAVIMPAFQSGADWLRRAQVMLSGFTNGE
jgi:hypothetical protein